MVIIFKKPPVLILNTIVQRYRRDPVDFGLPLEFMAMGIAPNVIVTQSGFLLSGLKE